MRPDPVALLEGQAASRVAELVPIRYGRMLVSPFTFYRGAALIMASDLTGMARSGLNVQLCGDAHLMNFGAFGSPERRMVFDINDFDETAPGPFEWDVKRLAASFAIAGRDNGFNEKERRRVAGCRRPGVPHVDGDVRRDEQPRRLVHGARHRCLAHQDGQGRPGEDGEAGGSQRRRRRAPRDSHQAFAKLTEVVDGQPRIISDPPLIEPIAELFESADHEQVRAEIHEMFVRYRQTLQSDRRHLLEEFRIVDVARKVVGVGSVGTRAWIVLLLGRDGNDPLFLQAKEAQTSVLESFSGRKSRASNGERVVKGQHLMQASSDIFLGWTSTSGLDGVKRDYYFRQLRDWKGSALVETMDPTALEMYARICGRGLARAHARSGDRIAISAYLGNSATFDNAIAEFSELYADQNERRLRGARRGRGRRSGHGAARSLNSVLRRRCGLGTPARQRQGSQRCVPGRSAR